MKEKGMILNMYSWFFRSGSQDTVFKCLAQDRTTRKWKTLNIKPGSLHLEPTP